MPFSRPVDPAKRLVLHETQLDGVVTISINSLLLNHHTGSGLYHRHGRHCAIRREYLSHTDLLTDYSVDHRNPVAAYDPCPTLYSIKPSPQDRSFRIFKPYQ